MMIEDQELRNLFKAESEEHLQQLDEGLVRLEKNPQDQTTLNEIFREAHSLKGAARMLGVVDVETIAHHFEGVLGKAKRGDTILSSETIDLLYQGLDDIRKLVNEAVTGEPANVDIQETLIKLGGNQSEEPEEPPEIEENQDINPIPEEKIETPTPTSQAEVKIVQKEEEKPIPDEPEEQVIIETGRYRIETIRVEPQKLDALMTQAGELTVAKIRIARRLAQIEEILSMWEEWSRESYTNQLQLTELKRKTGNGTGSHLNEYIQQEQERLEELGKMLNLLKNESAEDNTKLDLVSGKIEEGIRLIRLLPLSTIFNLYHRLVRDLARKQSKKVQLVIEGGDTSADKRILEEMKDPLMHMIRNAIDHGIEKPEERKQNGKSTTATIWLSAYQTATNIVIEVMDDGRGLDIEKIKQTAISRGLCREEEFNTMTPSQIHALVFSPGFSTSSFVTDISGRGVGMDVVQKNVERLKGTIQVESSPGIGCTFRVQLPITLATTRVLLVQVQKRSYAIPVEYVQTTLLVSPEEIFLIEGRETINFDEHPISVARLANLLELKEKIEESEEMEDGRLPCIILQIGDEHLGILVDALSDEQEVVLKPNSGILKRVRNVSGATILGTGEVCMVLNPQDMIRSVRKKSVAVSTVSGGIKQAKRKQVVLLVEDSITTRTQEKRILEGAGYDVITAVDGVDALNKLSSRSFDAIVSDIEMPNMDGFVLTETIREEKKHKELPLVLVTSLASEEDKRRGLEAGANAYITKGAFDQKVLLDTLKRLI